MVYTICHQLNQSSASKYPNIYVGVRLVSLEVACLYRLRLCALEVHGENVFSLTCI